MASLLPAAIRSTRVSSDEVSPAVAAIADTAATTAGCGRIDTLSMRGSPRSRFPSSQSGKQGCGSPFFFSEDWEPSAQLKRLHELHLIHIQAWTRGQENPNAASEKHWAGAIYCFYLCFPQQKSGTRLTVCALIVGAGHRRRIMLVSP